MPPLHPHDGRHENGQNMLVDRRTIAAIVAEVSSWPPGPLTEYAAGRGALTVPLATGGRPVTAVEIDGRLARTLRTRTGPRVDVVVADMLTHPVPQRGGVVANVPFHLTTPWLRRLLDHDGWEQALLLLQWEVARKRAGVGGATLLTARWWPWYDFALLRRVPARAFRPRPGVDGGLLRIDRRARPMVEHEARRSYQAFVARIFAGRGRGVAEIVTGTEGRRGARDWLGSQGIDPRARPRDLRAEEWVALHRWTRTPRR